MSKSISYITKEEKIEIAKGKFKNCNHQRTSQFIDSSFSGIGIYCLNCNVVIKWIIKPIDYNETCPYDCGFCNIYSNFKGCIIYQINESRKKNQ